MHDDVRETWPPPPSTVLVEQWFPLVEEVRRELPYEDRHRRLIVATAFHERSGLEMRESMRIVNAYCERNDGNKTPRAAKWFAYGWIAFPGLLCLQLALNFALQTFFPHSGTVRSLVASVNKTLPLVFRTALIAYCVAGLVFTLRMKPARGSRLEVYTKRSSDE